MRVTLAAVAFAGVVATLVSCSSQPIDANVAEDGGGGGGGTGGGANGDHKPSACSAALRDSLGLVDQVSTGKVSILSETGSERTLYIDASAGGTDSKDMYPWVYIALATGQAVAVSDVQALSSQAWDLAFKRPVVRTNGGDGGPGQGGAIRIALAWDEVDRSTLGKKTVPSESWFDADCQLTLDAAGYLVTTFSGWDSYNEATHVVSAASDVVFITAAADGTLYKVAILDYFSTPSGTPGNVSGRYKIRVAPLP